jgi:hypothetical protein
MSQESYRASQLKSYLEDVLWFMEKHRIEDPLGMKAVMEDTILEAREVVRLRQWSPNLELLLERLYVTWLDFRDPQQRYWAFQLQKLWHNAEWRTQKDQMN